MKTENNETYQLRLMKYKRRENLTVWVAAGLGGLVVLIGANVVSCAPLLLHAGMITMVTISAAAIALTRVGFEWKATQIERLIEENIVKPEDLLPSAKEYEWPKGTEGWWTVALVTITVAGILMLVAVWWSPVRDLFS